MASELQDTRFDPKLLSKGNVKSYILALCGLLGIIGLYYIFTGLRFSFPGGGMPPGSLPDGSLPPPGDGTGFGMGMGLFDLWPLWGQLVQTSFGQILVALAVVTLFILFVWVLFRKGTNRSRFYLIIGFGLVLIIGTNLIQGWDTGIYAPIGSMSEIYYDAINVDNFIDFIGNYLALQPSLSVHAQTQPPGAVLFIYFLSLISKDPAIIAILLAAIATIGSAIFVRGIYRRWYEKDLPDYLAFLFLLLPAVQIYYLANVYAIVAMLSIGVVYFYLHPKPVVSIVGSALCLFLATFTSFLAVFIILCLLLFEIFTFIHNGSCKRSTFKELGMWVWMKYAMLSFRKLLVLGGIIVAAFMGLYLILGFNYLATFSYASALESPNGFMLFSDPEQYFVTRLQDILDILVFFGPVLFVLFYRGLKLIKKDASGTQKQSSVGITSESRSAPRPSLSTSSQRYLLVIAALVALLMLFLTGAPKKGETARICMFILPFLLIPVVEYLNKAKWGQAEKLKLLFVVFAQAVVMQVIATYIW